LQTYKKLCFFYSDAFVSSGLAAWPTDEKLELIGEQQKY
jgi:hypothetical protein